VSDDGFGGWGWGSIGGGEKGRFIAITRVRDRVSFKTISSFSFTFFNRP
jgi:hypothetical protein